ncbi:hypothetical protein OAE37_00070 [Pirellulaceae bacterium]|nr:hypothetical protein [Pirellulaceae bacterium]
MKYASNSERRVGEWLETNGYQFTTQATFEGCRYKSLLRFDFYLEKHGILIEYDGEQHAKPVDKYGGHEGYRQRKIRDKIKTEFATRQGFRLIRITHVDRIGEYLDKNLGGNFPDVSNDLSTQKIEGVSDTIGNGFALLIAYTLLVIALWIAIRGLLAAIGWGIGLLFSAVAGTYSAVSTVIFWCTPIVIVSFIFVLLFRFVKWNIDQIREQNREQE